MRTIRTVRAIRTTKLLTAVLLTGGVLLAACGDDDSSASDNTAATTTTVESTTTSGAPSATGATVKVAMGAIGDHLVAADGRTLYLFEKDHGTTSACTGACADTWPALVADTGAPSGGTGVDAAKLSTVNGQKPNQVVYNGHLLYEFAGDQKAGDTNGTSIPSWYAVAPDGTAIDND